jgi:hypothetical protein
MKRIFGGLLGLGLIAALIPAQEVDAKEVNAWTMDFGGGSTIPVGKAGDLKNTQSGECLIHGSGITTKGQADWAFGSCGGKKAKILRKDSKKTGPLMCGETFALQLGNECFRKCVDPQNAGINICSETCGKDMHFQWQFKGCEAGKPVDPKTPLTLWNNARKDSLVYAKRPGPVVDTCWADKELKGVCTTVRDQ